MGQLQDLYELQQIDLKLDKNKKELKELPVFAEFKALQQNLAAAEETLGRLEGKADEQSERVKRLEAHMHKVEGERAGTEKILYDGTITQSRELEQLEHKHSLLLKERRQREEEWLAVMEDGEELQKSVNNAKNQWDILRNKLKLLQKDGSQVINIRKQEIALLQQMREQLAALVDAELINQYEEKRKAFQGRPLAAIVQDICGGCRISVSSNTKALLFRPDAIITCENCGRTLVLLT